MEKLLIINPGSTSTKIAVFEGETPLFVESLTHSAEELSKFENLVDQYEFRSSLILETMNKHGVAVGDLNAVVSRGGLLPPIEAGAYGINDDMVWQLRNAPVTEHASNLGALIANEIARGVGIPAFIYDAVGVDEMLPIAKVTGVPGTERNSLGHYLNSRAAAMRFAREKGVAYSDISVIVAHLGGGISVSIHNGGRVIDVCNDETGSFAPERAGILPTSVAAKLAIESGLDQKKFMRQMRGKSGLFAYFGTTDSREVEKLALEGDEKAKLVYDAMALNVAKHIAGEATMVDGRVDAILLTGGIAYSKYFTGEITKRVEFIAPVIVYAGENEMESLALGGLRVLRGQEEAKTFVAVK